MIDIETVVDADCLQLAPPSRRGDGQRSALHRIVCASILTFEEGEHGSCVDARLHTFHGGEMSEAAIIGSLDEMLPPAEDQGSRLVTYNGGYDLRVLRHRATCLWMFDLRNLRSWLDPAADHYDLMKAASPVSSPWSLAELAAAIGVETRTRGGSTARAVAGDDFAKVVHRCQSDVVATLLGYAYRQSFDRRCDVPAASAWLEVARIGEKVGLGAIAGHHLAALARTRMSRVRGANRSCGCMGDLS